MEKDLHKLDLVSLLDLYNTQVESLNSRLLACESWDTLADLRKTVTKLASLIHKKEPHLNLLQLNIPGAEPGAGSQEPLAGSQEPLAGSQGTIMKSQGAGEKSR